MKLLIPAVLVAAFASGCARTPLPDPLPMRSPADPTSETVRVPAGGTLADYTHRQPVDPAPWRRLNDEQAPGRGGAS